MNDVPFYFALGRQHITDWQGLDHILFITALCIRYQWNDWRRILILVTSFTIGHSITLLMSVLNMMHYSTKFIEFLIPITIMLTSINNLFVNNFVFRSKFPLIYFLALFFGLIHGLGFSNYLKSIIGIDNNILMQLLAFNIGLEVGQFMIISCILLFSFFVVELLKIKRREYLLYISGGILALAIQMALQRLPH